MNKPLLICITPVRNEAWILNAFLKATSLWADQIIIADQDSTDGSREIALSYPKVKLVDNYNQEMQQSYARKLLFDEVCKIEGPKIIFALDADEFLSGDFLNTEGWKKIINSKPGDTFFFKWINLCYLPNKCILTDKWMFWAANLDDLFSNTTYEDNYIHEWRLSYPHTSVSEIYIDDISFIHFSQANILRQTNKNRYYQVITKSKEPDKSAVSLYRMYHLNHNDIVETVPNGMYSYYLDNKIDLLAEIDFSDIGRYYVIEVLNYIRINGLKHYKRLDIWDKQFLNENNFKDPRSVLDIVILKYLQISQHYSNSFVIRGIDKLLKAIGV